MRAGIPAVRQRTRPRRGMCIVVRAERWAPVGQQSSTERQRCASTGNLAIDFIKPRTKASSWTSNRSSSTSSVSQRQLRLRCRPPDGRQCWMRRPKQPVPLPFRCDCVAWSVSLRYRGSRWASLLLVVLTIHPQMPSVTLATACGQTLKQSATSTLLLAVPMPLPNGSRQFNQTSHCSKTAVPTSHRMRSPRSSQQSLTWALLLPV